MTEVVIVSAARTPVGAFNGALGSISAHELGAIAIKGALERANVSPNDVDEVILGQVLAGGEGQNPARQAAMAAGIPQEKTAWGMNQLCGSGLRSVALGLQQIANGDAKVIVAGGMESMSMSPHLSHMRNGTKMGDTKFIDSMLKDGLLDAFHGYHMGSHRGEHRRQMADHPGRAGRVCHQLAEQGRGRAEGRQVQGRDRSRHRQDQKGRRHRRPG